MSKIHYRSGILRVVRIEVEDREVPAGQATCEVSFCSTGGDTSPWEWHAIDGQPCGAWAIGDRVILSIDPYEEGGADAPRDG